MSITEGGAAAVITAAPAAPAADPAAAAAPAAAAPVAPPADPAAAPAAPAAAASWFDGLSTEKAAADKLSDREWAENKRYPDVGALAKAHRQLEEKLGTMGGRLEIPKEGDPPEKLEAFYAAIGRPEKADGYEAPKLDDGLQLDETLFNSFRETAFKAGVPKAAGDQLAKWFVALQLDMNQAMVSQRDTETEAKFAEWGGQKDQNIALINRGATFLGIDQKAVADIQMGFGAARTLDLLLKIGQGAQEDVLAGGGERQRFGVTGAQARVELDRMLSDKDVGKLVLAKDPATIAKKDRLEAAIAAEMDREQGLVR